MVSAKSKRYQRDFIIFSNEDSGFEEGRKPSGYVKYEVRDRKGRLSVVIQNLRNGKERFRYALYLIRTYEGIAKYVRAGEIKHAGGAAELEMTFEQGFIGGTGYDIDDFDTFAVLAESVIEKGAGIACPLAAYRNRRTDWRGSLLKAMQPKFEPAGPVGSKQPEAIVQQEVDGEPGREATVQQKADGEFGREGTVQQEADSELGLEAAVQQEADGEPGREATVQQEADGEPEREAAVQQEADGESESGDRPELNVQLELDGSEHQEEQPAATENTDMAAQMKDMAYNFSEDKQQNEHPPGTINLPGTGNDQKSPVHAQVPPSMGAKYPENLKNLNTDCIYLNANLCGAVLNNEKGADPCRSCRFSNHDAHIPVEAEAQGDINGFEDELDKNFENSDPFHSRRSDYLWWRVTNPVNLNNMFYQNSIRSPLMFNPAVMMAHYKYKHLIIGVFTHKSGQRYIVCGVPAMHMVDPKPFGEIGKWVQAEGNRVRYGAFGYWLVYINPKDGKMVDFGH